MASQHRFHNQSGFTMFEILVVVALVGILTMVAVSNIKVLENPLTNTSANLTHYFRLVRARALSQTRSIKVTPSGTQRLIAASATSCSAPSEDFRNESSLTLDLDRQTQITDTSWSVCFNQRGLVHEYTAFTLSSGRSSKLVEIALGGGIRIR